jgi:hypothetical protein
MKNNGRSFEGEEGLNGVVERAISSEIGNIGALPRKVPEAELQPKDDGVLLFSRPSSHAIIINSLLAHSPYAPAIDVYDQGSLLAGYVFKSIDECLDSISHIIDTYLGGRTTHPPAK